jgi:hypothetical protein
VAVCALTGGAAASAGAQTVTTTTGAVSGLVIDASKGVVPGVTISLSGPALMRVEAATSDQSGAWHFSAVPPGDYTVTFELAGFGTIVREGVHVSVGFTATVSAELVPGGVSDAVDVRAGSAVIDPLSTEISTHFNSETLATLPGSRDFFAVAASTPGIAMTKMDVGGNGALALQDYIAYGLRAATGMNRNEVEGIRVGGANGANDNYGSDFGSFAEIAIKAAGNTAAMPVPGTLSQSVSKSGGNTYHGSLYADFQNEAMEATNIDGDQIALGVSGGPNLAVRDVNRLRRFRDFNADAGGYLKKDRAWWYGAYRSTLLEQRYAWLLDKAATLAADVGTGKVTYLLSPRQKLVGYLQHEHFTQSTFFNANLPQPLATSDALQALVFPVSVWKGEYNAAVTDALYVEARAGAYLSDANGTSSSTAPRIADAGANTVSGAPLTQDRQINRPQANGSVNFMKKGWAGIHNFRIGGEYMADQVSLSTAGYGGPCNCVSTLSNGVPTQVQILPGANVSRNDLQTLAGFVDDTWRPLPRLTVSLGIRVDRYQPGLPAQEGPAGQTFTAIDPVLTFNNWGPRAGISGDLTGDGKTLVKVHYGRFWVYPGPIFTGAFNPNPSPWSQTYLWTADANGNGRWDPGEEGRLISAVGGSASTRLDPAIGNTHVDQTTAYIEREVARDFGVRTGVVLNARRQPYATFNVSRPLSAFSVPVTVIDPGPDGRPGSADDGGSLTAFDLAPEFLGLAPVNLTTNPPDSGSDYSTWEITATKRQSGRWSLLASFTETWSREAALGAGNDFTANALVNSPDGKDRFTTWQAKVNGTLRLPAKLLIVPVIRHQSGTPFARTFVRTLNYGNATIKAEPIASNRTPDITLVDVRTEKTFRLRQARVMGFFDVYNLFNTNAAQTLTTSSGAAWLRPTSITGPRILRIGARVEW